MQQKLSKVQKTTGDITDGTAWLLQRKLWAFGTDDGTHERPRIVVR
jgi:hypothetical protein